MPKGVVHITASEGMSAEKVTSSVTWESCDRSSSEVVTVGEEVVLGLDEVEQHSSHLTDGSHSRRTTRSTTWAANQGQLLLRCRGRDLEKHF